MDSTNFKDIIECYKCIKREESNTQLTRDLLVALRMMLIPNMKYLLKSIVDESEKNQIFLEILTYVIKNSKENDLELFLNNLCNKLINGDFNAKMKIDLLNKLRKIKRFVNNLPKLECWYYENSKGNEKSFLGMIINDLSFFDTKLFQNFLKRKTIKNDCVLWLYNILKQNENRTHIGTDDNLDNYCSDSFMLKIMTELLTLYRNGKNSTRIAQIDLGIIYNKDYILDFGQTRNEIDDIIIPNKKRNFFNEYFIMGIKSIQLGFLSLINRKSRYTNDIHHLEESIEYLNQLRQNLLNSQRMTIVVESMIYLERIDNYKTELQEIKKKISNIDNLLSKKTICYPIIELISDFLYINKHKIEVLTDNLAETVLLILVGGLDNDLYINDDIPPILGGIINNNKFNYHTKIKVIDFLLKYNRITQNRIKFIDINLINSFHKFYIELGEKHIEDHYRLQVRYNILFLINSFVNEKGIVLNLDLYISNFSYLESENSNELFKSEFIKFIHGTISDLETIVSNAISRVATINDIDERIRNGRSSDNNLLSNQDILRLNRDRIDYSLMVKNALLIMGCFLQYIRVLSENDLRIFNHCMIINLFTTTIKYIFNKLVTNKLDIMGSDNMIQLQILSYTGNIIHNICEDDKLSTHFVRDDQSSIIDTCKSMVTLFLNSKKFNITKVTRLIDNIDYDIKTFINIKNKLEKENTQSYDDNDIPEELMDPIMMTLMEDPVELPSSNIILDKNTILQQLLHSEEDPYSRAHLTKELLEEHNMIVSVKSRTGKLKSKIEKWLHK